MSENETEFEFKIGNNITQKVNKYKLNWSGIKLLLKLHSNREYISYTQIHLKLYMMQLFVNCKIMVQQYGVGHI